MTQHGYKNKSYVKPQIVAVEFVCENGFSGSNSSYTPQHNDGIEIIQTNQSAFSSLDGSHFQ